MQKNEGYYNAYLSHHRISRRGLLRGVFGAAEKSCLPVERRKVARPPFACAEHLFMAACNGCGECSAVCPYGLIFIRDGKAVLEPDFSPCDHCGKCAQVCRERALHPAFSADTQLRPRFGPDCLQRRGQHCDACLQSCPQQAISPQLEVNNNSCNGCGECKFHCFMQAISLHLPD
ncbi:ferredoxin-type protein NapF [Mesocricetibacter intestinalis]|uniref:Ferredoxin-type protein NapF n=1 Tax=Mesocricetibacter intestinalis TaxID=1521930 RepID=A0A4R6VG70_9PAST|nr:ferredoxin-type protein NapF [Mesocricetibacter intestinalis]TDQ56656.1 ferredoxin-type protein NapF [Mesocricetibacter intestinalis]